MTVHREANIRRGKEEAHEEESEIGERSTGRQSSHTETHKATDTYTHTQMS
jgi:hypothetical protein